MPLSGTFLGEIEPQDQFLLAFPRSGSRWMIRLLSDLAEIAYGLAPGAFYERTLERLSKNTSSDSKAPFDSSRKAAIPDAHRHPRERSALLALGRTPMFRSHHLAEVMMRARGPVTYIARHPGPTLYSYFHFSRTHGYIGADVTLQEFFAAQLPFWRDHISTMLDFHRNAPGRVLFLTYRDPGPFVKAQLEAAAAHFEMPFKSETVDWALARMAGFLPKLNAHPSTVHSRGMNHAVLQAIPGELREWIHGETAELYQEVLSLEEQGP